MDELENALNIYQIENDISSHDENIINLDKFIQEQQKLNSVDQINSDVKTIQKDIQDIQSSIEQLIIGLNNSTEDSNEQSDNGGE